jgi:hypothetical protein
MTLAEVMLKKELQQQAMLQLLDRSVQPGFGLSSRKLAQRLVEGFGLNYDDIRIFLHMHYDQVRQQS